MLIDIVGMFFRVLGFIFLAFFHLSSAFRNPFFQLRFYFIHSLICLVHLMRNSLHLYDLEHDP